MEKSDFKEEAQKRLITQSAYAKKAGVSPSRVSEKIKAGHLEVLEISGLSLLLDPPAEYVREKAGRKSS
jgi:hypothetical protein